MPALRREKFTKETDILDVWFESGSSHAAVLGHEPNLPWPADLYLEGGDQYRGWFHSSLLCAVGTRGKAPYRMVSTNGWTLDEQGRAMSKSLNNGVDPVDVADRMGAEIVRLWVASVDFREDVACSEHLMQRVADNYRKIRNTFRYILGNLSDFDPQKNAAPFEKLEPLDQYMLRQTVAMRDEVVRWYDEFAFHKIYHRVNHFCVVELSAFYFDVLKDRLYTSSPNSAARRAAQTAIWQIGKPWRACWRRSQALPAMRFGNICRSSQAGRQAYTWRCFRLRKRSSAKSPVRKIPQAGMHGRSCVRCAMKF